MTEAMPQPFDVKLMNITALVLFSGFVVLVAAAFGWWLLRHPAFAVEGIVVEGEVSHNSVPTLRAHVMPRLEGNFFSIDLMRARQAFESVPWVRQAIVRRQFPNRLRVQLEEHRAVAYWGTDADSGLVNSYGEVFQANPGEVEQDGLPVLWGPEGESARVLAMYRSLKPLFDSLELAIDELTLTGRGSWTLKFDTGAVVDLGRGTHEEVMARTRRFAQTLTQVTSRFGRSHEALVSADLRHGDGYAVRLRGVTTTPAAQAN